MKSRLFALLALAALLMSANASAHDTWLAADNPHPRAGEPLGFHLTSGMAFPKVEYGPRSDRVARAGWRSSGKAGRVDSFAEGDSALALQCPALDNGLGVVWLTLRPKGIDLEKEEVVHYLDEIGAPAFVRAQWEADETRAFHETYTKHAKAFVRVGDGPAARNVLEPIGLTLEFVPAVDPTMLVSGDTLELSVLKQSRPLGGFSVGVACEDGTTLMLKADAAGTVRIPIHARGWWLVRGTEIRPRADGTFESDFTTLTFYAGGTQ